MGFNRIIFDALESNEISLEDVIEMFYDEDLSFKKYGLSELLRLFFSQPEQLNFEFKKWESNLNNDVFIQKWLDRIQKFTDDYQEYYFSKYKNFETGLPSYKKFDKTINSLIKENDSFYKILNEVVFNTNEYIKESEQRKDEKWSLEDLMTNPAGNNNRNICVMAIKFLMKQTAIKYFK